jgi:prenyltransferase beta subunit
LPPWRGLPRHYGITYFFLMLLVEEKGDFDSEETQTVKRVLTDQRPDGGWHLKAPDWDVHTCFDAVLILRQMSWDSAASREAISRAAEWVLTCQTSDGGFGHYPGWHSDMDAVYFQLGTLIQAGRIPGAKYDLPDAQTLSWGHAMKPGKIYARPKEQ